MDYMEDTYMEGNKMVVLIVTKKRRGWLEAAGDERNSLDIHQLLEMAGKACQFLLATNLIFDAYDGNFLH